MQPVNTEEMYKIIKKQNGEEFAKVLRENVLLDIPNLKHILEYAGRNPEDARNLVPLLREIRAASNKAAEAPKEQEIKDPIELLDEAGYDAFYVRTLLQQNSIKKYFEPHERLCTFSDGSRYKNYYMIHAVKKNVKNIKRSSNPQREDEYGTSVISIQIAKTGGFISIKNRYNHTVNNPDATFNNNPDNIIPGLTAALKKKFDVDFSTHETTMPNNYRVINDQLVRFNYEIENIYFGDKYYFIGSTITKLNPDYEIMLDTAVLDIRTGNVRKVCNVEYVPEWGDPFRDLPLVLNNEISGHKVKVDKNKKTGETIINIIDDNKNVKELLRTKDGCITSLHLYKTTELNGSFLRYNKVLHSLYAPKLKKINDFCFVNVKLQTLYIPELEEMGKACFQYTECLRIFDAPKLKKMGGQSFTGFPYIEQINVPELEEIGISCFVHTEALTEFIAPKLKKIGNGCFCYNEKLKRLYIPEIEEIGECFANTRHLQEFNAPKLKKMGTNCFHYGIYILKKLYAPELEKMGHYCFEETKIIKDLYVPKLKITEYTPKCIRRYIKFVGLKNGIKNLLYLNFEAAKNKTNDTVPQR